VDTLRLRALVSRVQATTTAHVEIEERLAKYFGFEKALITTTGYQAMVATVMALADRDTTLILDNLAHACILDGTFLAAGTPGARPRCASSTTTRRARWSAS
jgi:7-keto-8-aminopelargonate synthetase-like enzyme